MINKQVLTTVGVSLIAAVLFEFVIKPQIKKVQSNAN